MELQQDIQQADTTGTLETVLANALLYYAPWRSIINQRHAGDTTFLLLYYPRMNDLIRRRRRNRSGQSSVPVLRSFEFLPSR